MHSDPRRSWLAAFLTMTLLTLALAQGAHAGDIVERTVAFVNTQPVLLSEVALTRALLELDESAAIERTIEEVLMYGEAVRLVSEALPEEEVSKAFATLREKAGDGFAKAALRRKAIAQLTIAKYIDLRLRPLIRIEDAEVRRTFNERLANDPLAPVFNLVAQSIRETLERRSLDQRIEEWVASLRVREAVRRTPVRGR